MITTDDQRQQNGAEMKKNADGCKKWEEERAHFAFSRKKECCWYECPLPKPPLPDPAHTLQRYLDYARVIAENSGPGRTEVDLGRTERCVEAFRPMAQKLQAKLTEIAENSDNWINEFWLPEMYLRQRIPLPLNFNPAYIFPRQHFRSEQDQLDYAAWLVRGLLDFKEQVDRKTVSRETMPDRISETTVRMCMDQYERILNFYREPSHMEDIHHDRRQNTKRNNSGDGLVDNCDKNGDCVCDGKNADQEELISTDGFVGEHIVVISDRQQFVLFTRNDEGDAISAFVIGRQLAKIRAMARNRMDAGVQPIGGASTGERDRASAFWEEMNSVPINRRSLEVIRSAVFVLCLDNLQEEDAACLSLNGDKLTAMEQDGLQLLHGFGSQRNGLNRWFDATIQLIVSRNGCCGLCIEHSVAEGIVIINMVEGTMRFANEQWTRQKKTEQQSRMDPSAAVSNSSSQPKVLSWALSEKAIHLLWEQIAEFDQLARDAQIRVLVFTGFGKSAIKGWRVSPDGFVQLAMQLAHYRLHGYLISTYESATIRRFRYGRVDNIRAATPEALEWVKAMATGEGENEKERKKQQKTLFRLAAQKQALITRENITGHGIDNHLCALEVLSRAEDQSDASLGLFRDPAWRELMRFPLSTSQVSTSPEFVDCYLCYGPVVPDGYGCAYNIQQDKIIFAISAWKSNGRTSADEFRTSLRNALQEMGTLLEDDND